MIDESKFNVISSNIPTLLKLLMVKKNWMVNINWERMWKIITLHRLSISRGTFLVLSMSKGSDTASSSSSSMLLLEESPGSTSWCRPDVETVSGNRPLAEAEEPRDVMFGSAQIEVCRRRDGTAHTHNRPMLTPAEPTRPQTKRKDTQTKKTQKSKTRKQSWRIKKCNKSCRC